LVFATELITEMKNIFIGVSTKPFLLWQIAPLIILWIILEVYFGRYHKEKLGWNTALGNGISMMWIVLSALQFAFSNQEKFKVSWSLFVSLFLIGGYSIFIIAISFKHSFKSKWVYLFASPTPVYYFSIISLMIAHQVIILSLISIAAIGFMFLFMMIIFYIMRLLIPDAKKEIEDEEEDLTSDFDFKEKKSKIKTEDVAEDFTSNVPSELESELDSTFSSQADPFSNDFASTNSEKDLLLKKDSLFNDENPPSF
jgi:hypothetical protein